jgi:parallel beta-helix repeat protein
VWARFPQGNVIRDNCVRDVVGFGTTAQGRAISPHWAHGIYLDDHSSNMVVERNVLVHMLGNGLDMHAGSNNIVANNVIYGGVKTMDNNTAIGFFDGKHNMTNNTLERNVIVVQDPASLVLTGRPGALHTNDDSVLSVHRNIYWSPGRSLDSERPLFLTHSWEAWQAMGMDRGSVVDRDPGFVDAARGDWRLRSDALAHSIGFQPLGTFLC